MFMHFCYYSNVEVDEAISQDFFLLTFPVLATCGICPSDVAFENTFLCFSHLADSPDVR
jgi:hypothetical protein